MLLSYVILALSTSFAPLALGRPSAGSSTLDSSAEPGTLLGRHYLVQDRRVVPSASTSDASVPYDVTHAPRRLVPYPKYLADRSDNLWLRMRERRADDAVMDVNYLSDVRTYAPPKPFTPPPPPPIQPPPPPPVIPARPQPVASAAPTNGVVKAAPNKTTDSKHSSKTKMEKGKKKMRKEKKGREVHVVPGSA
ncbi:hypothetical protein GY45DRAFT_351133 [Cubamyces sp. BRFM 1775]|nr:hypothetical protein GY45DRAFT_351133 [Cubamyces sp. BRFM 1775]